jgi:hypothetical protein
MNIFALDKSPILAAQSQCDSHVIKMILESAQMLCTAHRVLDGTKVVGKRNGRKYTYYEHSSDALHEGGLLYKATHVNHPSNIWCRSTSDNYCWLYDHFIALCDEYTYRYGKVHLTDKKFRQLLFTTPVNIPQGCLTPFALAMKSQPQCMDESDPVKSYREFYQTKQDRMSMVWTKRSQPNWFKNK